jgi:hypothetical protein
MRKNSRNEKLHLKNESKKKSSRKKRSIASVDSSEIVLLIRCEFSHPKEMFLFQNQKKLLNKSTLHNDRKTETTDRTDNKITIDEETIINLDAMEKMVKKMEAIRMDNDQTEIIRMEIIIVRNNRIKTEANSFRFFFQKFSLQDNLEYNQNNYFQIVFLIPYVPINYVSSDYSSRIFYRR